MGHHGGGRGFAHGVSLWTNIGFPMVDFGSGGISRGVGRGGQAAPVSLPRSGASRFAPTSDAVRRNLRSGACALGA